MSRLGPPPPLITAGKGPPNPPMVTDKMEAHLKLVRQHLRVLDPPPKPPGMDDEALRVLGLFDFVHLRFPAPVDSHRDFLVDFMCSFRYGSSTDDRFRIYMPINAREFQFAQRLKPRRVLPSPPNVSAQAVASTATVFMDTYIMPVHKRISRRQDGLCGLPGRAVQDVNDGVVYRVDWGTMLWAIAYKEMRHIMHPNKRTMVWDCFYGAYWLRVLCLKYLNRFPQYVLEPCAPAPDALEPSAPAPIANLPAVEHDKDVIIIDLESDRPPESSRQGMSSSTKAFMNDDGRRTRRIDSEDVEDGDHGDVLGVSTGDVLFGGSGTRSAVSQQSRGAGEDTFNSDSTCNGCATETAAKNTRVSMLQHPIIAVSDPTYAKEEAQTNRLAEHIPFHENIHPEEMMAPDNYSTGGVNYDMCDQRNEQIGIQESGQANSYTVDISMIATINQKRKIVDGPCGEIITKKRGLITSFGHTEAQKDFNKGALGILPDDEEITRLMRTSRTYLEDWDASIKHITEIKQSAEDIVQEYVEKVDSVFDAALPPSPKKLDQNPGAPLQIPESACSRTKFAFKKIVADLKNLKTLANAEQFNQPNFIEEITVTLDGWENFFSSHFTEEINQMVTKLKILKKELDDDGWSGQQPKRTMAELSERMKKVGEVLEKAVFVREKITKSGMEIEHMKLAGNKRQESLDALETAHTNYIQEQERKITEARKKIAQGKEELRLVQLLKAKNADFIEKEMAASQDISKYSSHFEEATSKGSVLSKEIAKRCQQVEEDGDLPAPLQAMRFLIAHYPIKE